jgi:NAD(P)H-hydrate epimerase
MIERGVWPLVDAAEMRGLDRHSIETLGIPGEVLMESAGRSVTEVVLRQLPRTGGPVVVLCGTGNNGGDGLVIARLLHLSGVETRVVLLGDADRLSGDAALQRDRAQRVGVPFEDADDWTLPSRGVVVDAIFGTGLSRAVEGAAADAIAHLNAARDAARGRLRVVAVDLPSGLSSETGQPLGVAVRADSSVTIGLPKLGLTLEPGRSLAGEVVVARIGIADEAPDVSIRAGLWTAAGAAARLPARPADGHKGSFGHLLLVAASQGKTGAAALSARGAARAGAGLVTIACPAGLNDILEVKCTEAMTSPVADTGERALAAAAEDAILALAAERDVVAMGPGVGRSHETGALMRALAKRVEKPLVIDADGLYALRDEPQLLAGRTAPTVLTPHPGEAATLLGCQAAEINRDRVAAARQLADRTGAVVVLKGAATVIAGPDGRVIVNPTGGPALAAGGTGDVLLGMVGAYLGQLLVGQARAQRAEATSQPVLEAAALAAWVHGAAADRLARKQGPGGVMASQVADAVPRTVETLRRRAAGDGEPAVVEAGVGVAVPLLDA